MTLEEVLSGSVSIDDYIQHDVTGTRTRFAQSINLDLLERYDFSAMINILEQFTAYHSHLYNVPRESLYDTFHIPKRSGGLRRIDAPQEQLATAQRELRMILETHMYALYHTSAFAYVRKRSTVDAVRRHQANGSNWFLKLDFANFFGNTTPEFLLSQLGITFPFSYLMQNPYGKETLTKALDLCFLRGGLPQGTPISPMLTNLMMIPIDHALYNQFRSFNDQYHVYTRYADDLLISSRHSFAPKDAEDFVSQVLRQFNASFTVKPEKTRYGSSAGSNWNLGLMLNKDNTITLGYKAKKQLKAMINNYLGNRRNGIQWSKEHLQVMQGHINYHRMVERKYTDYILGSYKDKFGGIDILTAIREDLKKT
jgi:hypothetical protein